MPAKKIISFISGFVLLFFIYHFPEFFTAFWIMAVFKIGFLIIAFLLARLQGWKGLEGYGFGLSQGWAVFLLKGLGTGLLFFFLSVVVSIQLGWEHVISIEPVPGILKQLPMILLMTAIPSAAEDILTRGYLYAHLKQLKPWVWILISAVVYVLNHIWRLNDGPAVLLYLLLLGLVLALAVWVTKSLWLAFGIHWGANIAFESSRSFIQTKAASATADNTWLLAASWALLLVIMLVIYKNKLKDRQAAVV